MENPKHIEEENHHWSEQAILIEHIEANLLSATYSLHKILFSIILIALFLSPAVSLAQGDDCCQRHAVHGKYTLNDPMGIMAYEDAFRISLQNYLQQNLTRECFHFLQSEGVDHFVEQDTTSLSNAGNDNIWVPIDLPPHEYSFEAAFVSGINESTEEGRPIRSRLMVKMYFEGEQRELVHQWQTEGTWDVVSNSGTSSHGHFNKLIRALRDPDIMEIIEKFEKQPTHCTAKPEKEHVNPGEVITIKITDIRDAYGDKSREFNRLLIQAYSGEIINGEPCDVGPDYKAFRVNDGTIEVKYRAPSGCEDMTDRITVYNSCDILPKEKIPMGETHMQFRILEKTLYINCFDATLTIRGARDKNLQTAKQEDSTDGSCTTHYEDKHQLNEHIDAEIVIGFKQMESQDIPPLNQTIKYFQPVKVRLTKFAYNCKENKTMTATPKGMNCAGGYSTIINDTRHQQHYEITDKQNATMAPWLVVFDNETDKAVKIVPAGFEITYDIGEEEIVESTRVAANGTPKKETKESHKEYTRTFAVGPVGEEIDDPTIKQSDTWMQDYLKRQGIDLPAGVELPKVSNEETIEKIKPDILVSSGDGRKNFGGHGQRSITEQLDHGSSIEHLNYEWHMALRKKSVKN